MGLMNIIYKKKNPKIQINLIEPEQDIENPCLSTGHLGGLTNGLTNDLLMLLH